MMKVYEFLVDSMSCLITILFTFLCVTTPVQIFSIAPGKCICEGTAMAVFDKQHFR